MLTPFDRFDLLVRCPAMPSTAQETQISGAASRPRTPTKSEVISRIWYHT